MKLTDFESGIVFNIQAVAICAVFNRGPFREVRTMPDKHIELEVDPVYRVKEQVPDILSAIHTEMEE